MTAFNGSDMTWVTVCSALVMLMIPGLALFYGGMVKSKNVLSTTMHSYAALIIISIQWIFIGYSLAYGPDVGGIIGGFDWAFLNNVGIDANPAYSSTIPHLLFVIFQMMFAVITIAVISGSVAERMRFSAYILFALLWSTLVYDPVAHWVWGTGGWLKELGVLDFAGGNVVEIISGVSGLVAAIVLGKRKKMHPEPHHIPMAILGAGLLWFGWFGFNAGSALAMNGVAVNAFLNTNTAAAAGAISWAALEFMFHKKTTVLGTLTGAVAGLVSITQGAGYVTTLSSFIIGLIGGIVSFIAIVFIKKKFGYDDALDVFGCHGIAGIWGAIATGLFATLSVNENGANGLFYGSIATLKANLIGAGVCALYAAVVTFGILKLISIFVPLRADAKDESEGLDISLHGEEAYNALGL